MNKRPKCNCGKYVGKKYIGVICDICGGEVFRHIPERHITTFGQTSIACPHCDGAITILWKTDKTTISCKANMGEIIPDDIFTTRAGNALKRGGIVTYDKLKMMSDRKLLKQAGLGIKTLKEIRKVIPAPEERRSAIID